MKRITFALSTLLLAVGVIAFSAFTTKSFKHNAFAVQCYYFNGTNQYIPPGRTMQDDPRENSLDQTVLTTTTNWVTTSTNPPSNGDCTGGDYLCAICFELDNATDGDSDGALTLAEALNILWAKYTSTTPNALPAQGGNAGTVTTISVYRQPAVKSNHAQS